jgi:cation transport ATPase
VVRDDQVLGLGPDGDGLCERFLARVLSVEGVRSVALDRARASAAIRHDARPGELAGLLGRLAAAIRNDPGAASIPVLPRGIGSMPCTIHRHGLMLTTCEVVSDRPGRLQLRHPSLRRDRALAREVEDILVRMPGISGAAVGKWTGRLYVRYNPSVIDTLQVLQLIEELIAGPGGWGGLLPKAAESRLGLAKTTLGIAALTDLALPALMPLSAVLLVGTNLRTFQAAGVQVRKRRFGLPVLYTAIASTALASGQFFACALMSLFYKFWHHRLRLELATERRRLLHECLPRPRFTCLVIPERGEILVQSDRIGPGDRVVVRADETVPADGRVIEGEGIVDERCLRGLEGASRKRPGDAVLAGSTVLAGVLCVEVTRPCDQTRASSIERALVAATTPAAGTMSPTLRTEAFADRAVGPTLATAGVGLLIGDLATAGAVLGPDYATGPGLALPLETLRNAARCARRGIVVRRPDVFERLAQVDLIVLDDDPALSRVEVEVAGVQTHLPEADLLRYAASAFRHLADDRATALNAACRSRRVHLLDLPPVGFCPGVTVLHGPRRVRVLEFPYAPASERNHDREGADSGLGPLVVEIDGITVGLIRFGRSTRPRSVAALRRIREAAPVPIAVVSHRSEADVAAFAALLGVDLHKGGFAPDDTARFLRGCRERGLRTAFIGHHPRQATAAAFAHVAIALQGDADTEAIGAAAVLLQPRLDGLADLWEIARSHEERVRDAQKLVLAPNVLCVAGAFLFGFTSLASVMISNLGTFGLYNSAVGSLRAQEPATRGRSGHGSRTG